MQGHLRFSGLDDDVQRQALESIIRADSVFLEVLTGLRDLALPQGFLVAGAIYNHVWNVLTGKAPLFGVKDMDLVYFDAGDLSYEAEDVMIQAVAARFAHLPVPIELRNQARGHLWFPQKFNQALDPLRSAAVIRLQNPCDCGPD